MAREVTRFPFSLETGSLDSENRTLSVALAGLEMVAFCVCPGCLWFPWDQTFRSTPQMALRPSSCLSSVCLSPCLSTDFWSPCH